MSSFSLAEMVLSQQMLHTDATTRKDVALLARVDDSLPDPLWGDGEGIRQLVQHLVAYAVNRVQSGFVALTISGHECCPNMWQVLFCVRDSGPGLSADICAEAGVLWGEPHSVGQPAIPADACIATDRITPPALVEDLAQCALLARMIDTPLYVTSTPDDTCLLFEMQLAADCGIATCCPKQRAADTGSSLAASLADAATPPSPFLSTSSASSAAPDGSLLGIRVLLVEDSPLTSSFAMNRLREAGADAIAADTGEQALEQVRQHAFDVALVDVRMPGMDGYTVARRIRELGNTPEYADLAALPVLGMNFTVSPELEQRVQAAGMDGLISKPIHPDTVLATLRHVCGMWQAQIPSNLVQSHCREA